MKSARPNNRAPPPAAKRARSVAAPPAATSSDATPRIYWLGDSTTWLLARDGKKQKDAGACEAAWEALHEELPSVNLGARGAQLVEQTDSLKRQVDHVLASAPPAPRAFVVSAGYNDLGEQPSFIVDALTAQLDRLHAKFPDAPALLLGLAISHNCLVDKSIETAQAVTEMLAARLQRPNPRSGWLTMVHPDVWIAREADFPFYASDESTFPHWEDEVLRTGSSPLHLSIKSRVRQLGEIKSVLRKLLLA